MEANFVISEDTASSSCSSRLFMSCAALSSVMINSSAASFWTRLNSGPSFGIFRPDSTEAPFAPVGCLDCMDGYRYSPVASHYFAGAAMASRLSAGETTGNSPLPGCARRRAGVDTSDALMASRCVAQPDGVRINGCVIRASISSQPHFCFPIGGGGDLLKDGKGK